MLKEIKIEEQPGRDITNCPINFKKEIMPYKTFGISFMVFGVIVALSAFLPPYEGGLIVFKIIGGIGFMSGMGFIIFQNGQKKLKNRLEAYKNGRIVEGIVVKHSMKFVFWKSTRNYEVVIKILLGNGKERFVYIDSAKNLHHYLPINTTIKGIHDTKTNAVFFPEEIGYRII